MTIELSPESDLKPFDSVVEQLLAQNQSEYSVDTSDELYGASFRRFMLFVKRPRLLNEGGMQLTAEQILYNCYYWMFKFAKQYQLKHGYDAGIEQQTFQVLENAGCDFDWSVIERIERQVETELVAGS